MALTRWAAVGAAWAAAPALWAAGAAAQAAGPVDWRVDPERSSIVFEYALNSRPAQGLFRRIEGEGTFDPDAVGDTRLRLEIDVTSLDLGDPLESAFALSPDWFDAATHPRAVYRLAALTPLGDAAFEALGDLTIKGRTVILRTPIRLSIDGASARAQGALRFDRRDFRVGFGPSALFVAVGTDVAVTFDIVAAPAP